MNKEESSASGKVIDSLINYETIKLFGRETFEADRYDASLQRYQAASVRTQTSLSALNFGQNFIFSCGLTAIMCMAVNDITSGESKWYGDCCYFSLSTTILTTTSATVTTSHIDAMFIT